MANGGERFRRDPRRDPPLPLTRTSHQLSWRGRRGAVPSGVFDQEARPEPPVPSADGAREPRSRREEESMPEHRRRRATKRLAATPIGPKGCGAMAPSSSLPLLGDGVTSPSSRRLEYGVMALATEGTGGCGRASQGAQSYLTVRRAPRGEKTPLGAVHRRPQQEAGEICRLGSDGHGRAAGIRRELGQRALRLPGEVVPWGGGR